MNHIYKVIWNKAKHCYTVVSEIAKSHSTSSVTKKKVSIAAILAVGMLSGFSPMVSGAADTTNSEAVVYDQNKTSLKSTNSNGVGKKAIALGNGAFAVGDSIAIGNGAYTQDGSRTYGQSVALGNGAVTGAKSTSIGSKAIGGREGTITIGANANNGAVYATIVGTAGNTVTGAYKDMGLDFWDSLSVLGGNYSVLAEKESGAIAIIGGANTISNQTSSTVIGFGNTLKGENSTGVFTADSHNTLTNVSNSLVMGDYNTLKDRKNVISLGNNNTVTADDAVAIGNGTTVRAESGVAIGVGSVADRVADSEKGKHGAFAPDTIPTGEESTWASTRGAVSVGDTANNITRQITNVAAGNEDTDAVNVAQLKQVASQAERANQGWNLTTNGVAAAATNVAPGGSVDFSGDDNVSVSNKETKVTVALNKNINVNNVQTNALNAKYNLSVGTANENGTVPFFVNSNGAFYAANGKLVVDKDGKVTATEGEIGNVVLKNGVLYKNTALRDGELYVGDADGNYSQITPKSAKLGQVTIDEKGNMAGVNSVQTNALNAKYNLSVGTAADNGTMPFFVNSNGAFYAAGGEFVVDKDGSVKATSGDIGNVKLNDGVFYKNSALRDGELYVGDADGNYSQITSKNAKLGKVMIDDTGRISGVAAGRIAADSTDAINGSQLHEVATEAGKHSKVVNGSNITVEETDQDGQKTYKVGLNKDILLGDITGKNVSISGTMGTIETTGYIATKDRIIADKGAQLADITVSGNAISNGEAKVALDGAAGTAGMINGKGASLYMQDGTTVINNKVGIDQEGKITGVAAGKISADSTDAVNGSQLHAVATEAGKHSKVVNGININVEETDVDGQKIYKVGLNDDILLGKLTGNNVSISGTNGTIETTGYIATKDRIIADKGAQLADITVSGNAISNGEAKVALDGAAGTAGMINGKGASLYMQDGTTVINNKVGIDQEGKITGVAAGEISATSKDAVNGSQLKQTNDKVDALDKRVTQNEADIKQNKADIAQNKADIAQNKADIAQNKADIAQNKADIAQNKKDINKLDTRVTNVEELAKKHTTVAAGDNITVTEGTNKDGGKNYTVAMKKDITVDSVKAGDTTINTEGVRIGDTTSLKKDSLTIGGKTYVTDKGLNANNQTITNVADGKVEKGSKDAVNGSQLFATNQKVVQNAQSINKLGNRINKVGAGAAALAALHPLDFDPDDKWDIAAGYGNYNGENAAAIGAYYRPNEDTMFSVGGSFGNGENMVNAGVSLKLGQGNHVSTSKVAMAKEIKDLRKELEGLKSALLDVNAGKKLDTSKLQLFPDVPKNHWAYEYVSTLKGNGVLTGYPDGEFKGDRPMTRYEFATMLYKAMLEGATLSDKILKEFAPELERFTVDTVHQDKDGKPTVERVRTVKAEK